MKPSKEDIACLLKFKNLNSRSGKGEKLTIRSVFDLCPPANFQVRIDDIEDRFSHNIGFVKGRLSHPVTEVKACSYKLLTGLGQYVDQPDTCTGFEHRPTPEGLFDGIKRTGSIASFYLKFRDLTFLRKVHILSKNRDLWFEFKKGSVTLRSFCEKPLDKNAGEGEFVFTIDVSDSFSLSDYTAKITYPSFLKYLRKEEYQVDVYKRANSSPDNHNDYQAHYINFLGLDSGLEFTTVC